MYRLSSTHNVTDRRTADGNIIPIVDVGLLRVVYYRLKSKNQSKSNGVISSTSINNK